MLLARRLAGRVRCDGVRAVSLFVARTREDLDRLIDLALADDSIGISHMRLAGRIWMVPNGTKCKVIKSGFTVYEVRLMEGRNAAGSARRL